MSERQREGRLAGASGPRNNMWLVNWPRLGAEGASSPEMPVGTDNKSPNKRPFFLAKDQERSSLGRWKTFRQQPLYSSQSPQKQTKTVGPTLTQASKAVWGARSTPQLSRSVPSHPWGSQERPSKNSQVSPLSTLEKAIPHRHTHDVSGDHVGAIKRNSHPSQTRRYQ